MRMFRRCPDSAHLRPSQQTMSPLLQLWDGRASRAAAGGRSGRLTGRRPGGPASRPGVPQPTRQVVSPPLPPRAPELTPARGRHRSSAPSYRKHATRHQKGMATPVVFKIAELVFECSHALRCCAYGVSSDTGGHHSAEKAPASVVSVE